MAEYYEWLTPEHSGFGLSKTRGFFEKTGKSWFSSCNISSDFLAFYKSTDTDNKITAIDILPSKYTEVKKRYWSKA